MLDEVQLAIANVTDLSARPRLARCVPMLDELLKNWSGSPGGPLTLAVVTPASGIVMHAAGWPDIQHGLISKEDAATALVAALRQPAMPASTTIVILATTVPAPRRVLH